MWGWIPGTLRFKSSPGDSSVHPGLRSIDLKYQVKGMTMGVGGQSGVVAPLPLGCVGPVYINNLSHPKSACQGYSSHLVLHSSTRDIPRQPAGAVCSPGCSGIFRGSWDDCIGTQFRAPGCIWSTSCMCFMGGGRDTFGYVEGVAQSFYQSLLVPGSLKNFDKGTQMVGSLEPYSLVMNKSRGEKQFKN